MKAIGASVVSRRAAPGAVKRIWLEPSVRLGLVTLEGDLLIPVSLSFLPSRRLDELTALFAANAADHMAAAVNNLTTDAPRYLEQSVFADGLAAASVDDLHELARQAWQEAFETMVKEARKRVAADDRDPPLEQYRMRFGVYFYGEPQAAAPAEATGSGPAARAARPATKRKKA